MKRALFIGRFQPFHLGHQHAVKDLLKRFDEVVIVMGSSMQSHSPENPFTAGERIEMIRLSFNKSEIARIIVVPVPDIHDNEQWVSHILMHVPQVDDIYSNNGMVKHLFACRGIKVKTLSFLERQDKEGSKIRNLMVKGENEWKDHVPPKVAKYLVDIEAPKRMKEVSR